MSGFIKLSQEGLASTLLTSSQARVTRLDGTAYRVFMRSKNIGSILSGDIRGSWHEYVDKYAQVGTDYGLTKN